MNTLSFSSQLLARSRSDGDLEQQQLPRDCSLDPFSRREHNRTFPLLIRASAGLPVSVRNISPDDAGSVVKVGQRIFQQDAGLPSSYPSDVTQSLSYFLRLFSRNGIQTVSNPRTLKEYFESWMAREHASWRLEEFSRSIPKGDIHSHFTGAIPPESLLRAAGRYGLVFDLEKRVALYLKEVFNGRYKFAHPSQEGTAHTEDAEEMFALFERRQGAWEAFMQVDPMLKLQFQSTNGVECSPLSQEKLYRNFIAKVNDLGVLWDDESLCFVRSETVFKGGFVLFTRMSQIEKERFKQECTVSSERGSGRTNYEKFHTAVFVRIESITERLDLSQMFAGYIPNQVSDKVVLSTPSKGAEIRKNERGEKFSEMQLQTLRDLCPRYELANAQNSDVMRIVEGFLNCGLEEGMTIRSCVEKSVQYWKEYVLEGFENTSAPEHREYAPKLLYFSKLKEAMEANFSAMERGERIENPVPYWDDKTALFLNIDLCRQQDLSLFILDLEIAVKMVDELPEYVTGIVVSGKEDDVYAKEQRLLQLALLKAYIDRSKEMGNPLHVSIHAGEMDLHNNGEVQELKTVIFDAIETGAERIGHGLTLQQLDVAQKADLERLLDERRICIETCLSSNINLGFTEKAAHPFPAYLSMIRKLSGAGLTFNTDDMAVFMTSLSQELFKAISDYKVPYDDLLKMLRDSIRWSFAPGEEIYNEVGYELKPCFKGCQELDWQPSKDAQRILLSSTRACLAVQFERLFSELEKRYLSESTTNTTNSSESEELESL